MRSITFLLLAASAVAQTPALTPTSNLTLDTTVNQGQFAFSYIDIPAGVRVTFNGPHPVQIRCNGDAVIRGRLDVDASGTTSGPGAVTTGAGSPGIVALLCGGQLTSPGHASHAGNYGSELPFDLAGGSPGGDVTVIGPTFPWTGCTTTIHPGGGDGGTLVLEAEGAIDVYGTVSANGDVGGYIGGFESVGSGGSILLRGIIGVTVHVGANIQAIAATNSLNVCPPGIIRLDAHGQPPVQSGNVNPAPAARILPNLAETVAPVRGQNWMLRVAAARGDVVFLASSFQPGSFTSHYGTVGIDIHNAISFAIVAVPQSGHDPLGYSQLAIPSIPSLAGLDLWTAGLNWFTARPPRFSNTIQSVVQ
ncbi:MAG: hypothetical protein NXI31_10265 [bacterium]|nr:hypothetical protein [bacterium]